MVLSLTNLNESVYFEGYLVAQNAGKLEIATELRVTFDKSNKPPYFIKNEVFADDVIVEVSQDQIDRNIAQNQTFTSEKAIDYENDAISISVQDLETIPC